VGVEEADVVVDVVVDDPVAEHWENVEQDTEVTVAVIVPETLNLKILEQSVAVAVSQDDVDDDEVVVDSSLSLSGSGSLTGGFGL
jgi:hypothetical protein